MPVLEVQQLHLKIHETEILRGIDFSLEPAQTLGLAGESGCGKTMIGMALMGMIPAGGRITNGSITLDGRNLTELPARQYADIRGSEIAMVMQDPFTSLNPVMRVGEQVAEAIVLHRDKSWSEARRLAVDLLDKVGIPDPEASARKYPHQLSGGQRQRVVIAIAFSCHPKVLIADEPTTALDVTLQAQVLRLLKTLQEEEGTAVVIISHNIGVIAAVSDDIGIVYAGQIVEMGSATQVLKSPKHPYTQGLLNALPKLDKSRLNSIPGSPPDFAKLGGDCAFRPRCEHAHEACLVAPGKIGVDTGHHVRCWLYAEANQMADRS